MELDLRTIVLILGITHLIQVVVFYYQYRLKYTYRGIGWWLLWSVAESIGFSLVLLRNNPEWLPAVIIIQNAVIVAANVFLNVGINKFVGKPLNFKIIIPVCLVFMTVFAVFLFIFDNIQVRAAAINVTIAIFSFLSVCAKAFMGRSMKKYNL